MTQQPPSRREYLLLVLTLLVAGGLTYVCADRPRLRTFEDLPRAKD